MRDAIRIHQGRSSSSVAALRPCGRVNSQPLGVQSTVIRATMSYRRTRSGLRGRRGTHALLLSSLRRQDTNSIDTNPKSEISFTLSSVYHSTSRSTYSQEKTNKTRRGCCVYVAAPTARRKKEHGREKKGNPQTKTTKLPPTSAPSTPALIGRNMQRCARPRLLQTQEKRPEANNKGRDETRNAKRVFASGDKEAKERT